MVWLLPHPPPVSKLERRHTGRLRKRDNLRTGKGKAGAKSYDGEKAWSSGLSLNTLCKHPFSVIGTRGKPGVHSRSHASPPPPPSYRFLDEFGHIRFYIPRGIIYWGSSSGSRGQIHSLCLRGYSHSGTGLPYRPYSLCSLAGRYDKTLCPELTLSPQSGSMNLATVQQTSLHRSRRTLHEYGIDP
jgi:hypothetical protein